jgi:hypothetical protein
MVAMHRLSLVLLALAGCSDPDTVVGSYDGTFTLSAGGAAPNVETDVLTNVDKPDGKYEAVITISSGDCIVQGGQRSGTLLAFDQPGSCTVVGSSLEIDSATGTIDGDQLQLMLTGASFTATYAGTLVSR